MTNETASGMAAFAIGILLLVIGASLCYSVNGGVINFLGTVLSAFGGFVLGKHVFGKEP